MVYCMAWEPKNDGRSRPPKSASECDFAMSNAVRQTSRTSTQTGDVSNATNPSRSPRGGTSNCARMTAAVPATAATYRSGGAQPASQNVVQTTIVSASVPPQNSGGSTTRVHISREPVEGAAKRSHRTSTCNATAPRSASARPVSQTESTSQSANIAPCLNDRAVSAPSAEEAGRALVAAVRWSSITATRQVAFAASCVATATWRSVGSGTIPIVSVLRSLTSRADLGAGVCR